MNRKQKIAIVVGALVIAGLALFPPWVECPRAKPGMVIDRLGHHGIHDAPKPSHTGYMARIDTSTLYIMQLPALVLTVAAVLVLKDRKNKGDS